MLGPNARSWPVVVAFAGGLTFFVGACDSEPGDDAGAVHNELLAQVQGENYRTWARPPVGPWMVPLQPSHAPHGEFVDIYLNNLAGGAFAVEGGQSAWPDGSIFVLDGWKDAGGGELAFIAIAAKQGGAWYWEEYLADDLERPTYAGAPDVCVGCHAAGVDFIRSVKLP